MRRIPDPSRGYPRPQLERENWISLNGQWDFAVGEFGYRHTRQSLKWDRTIEVPFSPETPRSGIAFTG